MTSKQMEDLGFHVYSSDRAFHTVLSNVDIRFYKIDRPSDILQKVWQVGRSLGDSEGRHDIRFKFKELLEIDTI